MSASIFAPFLEKAMSGDAFSQEDMESCIYLLMDGSVEEESVKSFLSALHNRGETTNDIIGAARALRARVSTISAPVGSVDCCGTGGDGAHAFNISTAVALVSAACGVPVAKHGNRAASSQCGAADVLEKIGVPLSLSKDTLQNALQDIGFCFLMAPHHHAGMKNVALARKSLPHRTIFNLIGPLANPAGTKTQLIGVFDSKWVFPLACALKSLGSIRAMVVHGQDGLDEISLSAPTDIALLEDGKIIQKTIYPSDFGLPFIRPDELKGGDAQVNAAALLGILNGAKNAYRDMVLANTAAVLYLHNSMPFKDGVALAALSLDNGRALDILNRYKELK